MPARWPYLEPKEGREDGFYSFLSYSTWDSEVRVIKPFVDEYVHLLRKRVPYVPVFYDEYYVPRRGPRVSEDKLRELLARGIELSDFTTAFLSPGYAASPWCAYEWSQSRNRCSWKGYGLFQILWKRFAQDVRRTPFGGYWTVDVSNALERRKYRCAAEHAVESTLEFLDSHFGPEPWERDGWLWRLH